MYKKFDQQRQQPHSLAGTVEGTDAEPNKKNINSKHNAISTDKKKTSPKFLRKAQHTPAYVRLGNHRKWFHAKECLSPTPRAQRPECFEPTRGSLAFPPTPHPPEFLSRVTLINRRWDSKTRRHLQDPKTPPSRDRSPRRPLGKEKTARTASPARDQQRLPPPPNPFSPLLHFAAPPSPTPRAPPPLYSSASAAGLPHAWGRAHPPLPRHCPSPWNS